MCRRRLPRGGEAASTSCRQQQLPPGPEPKPAGGHDGGGCEAVDVDVVDVDLLSSLHDDVLGSIVMLLNQGRHAHADPIPTVEPAVALVASESRALNH